MFIFKLCYLCYTFKREKREAGTFSIWWFIPQMPRVAKIDPTDSGGYSIQVYYVAGGKLVPPTITAASQGLH